MEIDLVILAGGRSSRMGANKLLLRRHGRLLIDEWISAISWPSMPLVVLPPGGEPPVELQGVRVAHDALADQGPLRGVITALEHRQSEWQVIVPIDMPNLRRSHIGWLCGRIDDDPAARLWMLRRTIGKDCAIEPFPLLIHSGLLPSLMARLNTGRRSLHGLGGEEAARVIDAPTDWPDDMWLNLNRPEDLRTFLKE